MAHPETNPNFSISSAGPSHGGNPPGQPGPTFPRSTRRNMPRFAQEQPQSQFNEPQNPIQFQDPPGQGLEPRSRVLDQPISQPEPPNPIQSPPGWGLESRNRVRDQQITRLEPLNPIQSPPGWGLETRNRVRDQQITRPEPQIYSESNHFPIHVGQRQGLPPPKPEKPRPKRSKSNTQKLQQPDPQAQPAPTNPTRDHTHQPAPLLMHRPQKTKAVTWCIAIFCAVFWIIIIAGGLIVLIVYLIFRPHIPHFDIDAGSLNAAYLDNDLLNADLSLLVNFTNPNKKVSVDFSYVILDLYYGNTPIATQYIEPFSAVRSETALKSVEMISSQVYLSSAARQNLRAQMESNGLVIFTVKGVFRARSNLGSLLRYSYPLYSHCTIYLTGPPAGVLRGRRCKTKRRGF